MEMAKLQITLNFSGYSYFCCF